MVVVAAHDSFAVDCCNRRRNIHLGMRYGCQHHAQDKKTKLLHSVPPRKPAVYFQTAQPLAVHANSQRFSFACISGKASKRSATIPKSADSKIGASGSLFTATMTLLSLIPAIC